MIGGGEVKNSLTLDASQFDSAIEQATKKAIALEKELDNLGKQSTKLDSKLADTKQGMVELNRRFSDAEKTLGTTSKTFTDAQKKVGETTKNVDLLSRKLEKLTGAATQQKSAIISLKELTDHYGNTIDGLNPVLDRVRKTEERLGKSRIKHAGEGAEKEKTRWLERRRILAEEEQANQQSLKSREQLYKQYEALERKLETVKRNATSQANKFATATTERGLAAYKNHSGKANAAEEQLTTLRQTKLAIEQSVSMLRERNKELKNAIKITDDGLRLERQERDVLKEQNDLAKKRNDTERERIRTIKDIEKAERGLAALKDRESKQQIANSKQEQRAAELKIKAEERDLNRLERLKERNHQAELARRRREAAEINRANAEAAAAVTAVGAGAATVAGVHEAASYQDVEDRVRMLNLSPEEFNRFKEKSWDLASTEKYLSRTAAMQTRLDALTAIGYNKEPTIDKTISSASRNAYLLRSLGYENGTHSDVVKNLYGFAEARQVMDDPNEVNKSFDIARRMAVASGGKIKMADIETVARNIGDLRQTMSSEGWIRLAAVMEQFKTAGGGNGGGGGVSSVGTIFKMMSLYASGKPITNTAALNLLGADVMNDAFADGTSQQFQNSREIQGAMMKAVKTAGFKDVKEMSKDPIKFFAGLRGQLLDYMMQDAQFKKFFGANTPKHSYNAEGRMIGANGQLVDQRTQDDIENAAFKRFFAQSGMSNKTIDGMLLTMNRSFVERSNHAAETAMGSQGELEAMQNLTENWNANMDILKASLADFAVTFEPLLAKLAEVPKFLASIIRSFSEFGKDNPTLATLSLMTVGFGLLKVTAMATLSPIRMLLGVLGLMPKSLENIVSSMKNLGTASGAAKTSINATKDTVGKAASEFASFGTTAEKSAERANAGVKGFTGKLSGHLGSVKVFAEGALRLLGSLVNWAGWLILAGQFGWAIGKWIGSLKVGGTEINTHIQNIVNDIVSNWDLMINSLKGAWLSFKEFFTGEQLQARAEIQETRRQIKEQQERLHVVTEGEKQEKVNNISTEVTKRYANLLKGAKVGDTVKGVKVTDSVKNWANAYEYSQSGARYGHTDVKAPRMPYEVKVQYDKAMGHVKKNYGLTSDEQKKTSATTDKDNHTSATPAGFMPGTGNHDISSPTLATKPKKDRGSGGSTRDFESKVMGVNEGLLAKIAELNVLDDSVLEKGAPDYYKLAKLSFIKEWMQGNFDDGRNPKNRPFANRSYQKGRVWKQEDIDWNAVDPKTGISVEQILKNMAQVRQLEDMHKSVQFAVSKSANANENFKDSLEDATNDIDNQSDALAALRREFARFEAKNPFAYGDPNYVSNKNASIAMQTASDYLGYAKKAKNSNSEDSSVFVDNEYARNQQAVNKKYDDLIKPYKLIQSQLDEQIASLDAVQQRTQEQEDLYAKLLQTRKDFEEEFSEFYRIQEEKRRRELMSTYDQAMIKWRDYETTYRQTISDLGVEMSDGIFNKFLKGDDVSLSGILSESASKISQGAFRYVWQDMSKRALGDGANTDLYSMGKSLLKGEAVDESGFVGKWLNKIRGLTGVASSDSSADSAEASNTIAVNANTAAIQNLTAVLGGQSISSAIGGVASAVGGEDLTTFASAVLGPENVGAIDYVNGSGGFLDQLAGGFEGGARMDPNLPGFLNGGLMDKNVGGSLEGAEGGMLGGLFAQIKSGFMDIFGQGAGGGIFSTIKSGFSNLFSNGSGLMSSIGSAFSSLFGGGAGGGGIFSSLASAISGLFSGGGGAGGGMGGAGGWIGAAASIASSFFANGGAFGSGTHAFANGGAFTNGIYDSPTYFKFAKGGGFANGVMGEAGPEAVMPLQRDSSGRLGVALNGGAPAGGGTVVSINIEVNNNGDTTTESSTGGDNESNWKDLSNRVKSLVQEEIVKQKRPGGMLRSTNQ
ncbi:phage tail protein [Acinetobacter baumannii]|nr:phage tail protein [Acinetobacter baumannii]